VDMFVFPFASNLIASFYPSLDGRLLRLSVKLFCTGASIRVFGIFLLLARKAILKSSSLFLRELKDTILLGADLLPEHPIAPSPLCFALTFPVPLPYLLPSEPFFVVGDDLGGRRVFLL